MFSDLNCLDLNVLGICGPCQSVQMMTTWRTSGGQSPAFCVEVGNAGTRPPTIAGMVCGHCADGRTYRKCTSQITWVAIVPTAQPTVAYSEFTASNFSDFNFAESNFSDCKLSDFNCAGCKIVRNLKF